MDTIKAEGVQFVQAAAIKGMLSLRMKGMTARGHTGTQLLAAATRFTGKTYKRGQYAAAHADMVAIVETAIASRRA